MKKLIATSVAVVAFAFAPALAAKFRVSVSVVQPSGDHKADGTIYLGEDGARAYDGPIREFLNSPVDEDGNLIFSAGGAASTMAADEAAAAKHAANIRAALNLNSTREIIYDYVNKRRIAVDHLGKTIKKADLSEQSKAGGDIVAGAPQSAESEQLKALTAMLGQFTDTSQRVNPRHEITLIGESGQGKTVTVNDIVVGVKRRVASRMGGEFAEIWVADPSDLPKGAELLEAIKRLPLSASNRANDPLGALRQIALAPNGGIPLEIGYFEPELEPLAPGETRQVAIRLEVNNYEDGDQFSVYLSETVSPEKRGQYKEFAEPTP